MVTASVGAGCFGAVIGWIVYRTLRRREGPAVISDIATVLGAVGGGAVTVVLQTPELFGAYGIGLAVGFFTYLAVSFRRDPEEVKDWMGE